MTPTATDLRTAFRDGIATILDSYAQVRRREPWGRRSSLWGKLKALEATCEALVAERPHLSSKVGSGVGRWASIPWITFTDDRETESTKEGVYVVYLFREDMSGVYLTLAQGITVPREVHGDRWREVIREKADQLWSACASRLGEGWGPGEAIDLRASGKLGRGYEEGVVVQRFYPAGDLPGGDALVEDLEVLLTVYEQIVEEGVEGMGEAEEVGVGSRLDVEAAELARSDMPGYGELAAVIRLLDGVEVAKARALRKSIRDIDDGDEADWQEPARWIPEQLGGDAARLALELWEESNQALNPRYLYKSRRMAMAHDLLEVNDGVYRATERGWEYVRTPRNDVVAHVDQKEGLAWIMAALHTRDGGATSDLLEAWSSFARTHSRLKSDASLRSALRFRLSHLMDRELIDVEGHDYHLTDAGRAWLAAITGDVANTSAGTRPTPDYSAPFVARAQAEVARNQKRPEPEAPRMEDADLSLGYYPTREALCATLSALDGVDVHLVSTLRKTVMASRGTPDDTMDWSDPDAWIPEVLEGEVQALALKIWESSSGAVNPRYVRVPRRIALANGLLERQDGVYVVTDAGRAYLEGDEAVTAALDVREGLGWLLREFEVAGGASSRDIFDAWVGFASARSQMNSPRTLRIAINHRLEHLVERGLLSLKDSKYHLTSSGRTWLHTLKGDTTQAAAPTLRDLFARDPLTPRPPIVHLTDTSPEVLRQEAESYAWAPALGDAAEALARAVDAPGGRAVWVSGAAGVGKTLLVKMAAAALEGEAAATRWLAEAPEETARAWEEVLEGTSVRLVRVDLGADGRPGEPVQAALRRAVARALGYSPLKTVMEAEVALERQGEWALFEETCEDILGKRWSDLNAGPMADEVLSELMHDMYPRRYRDPMLWYETHAAASLHGPLSVREALEDLGHMMARRSRGVRVVVVADGLGEAAGQSLEAVRALGALLEGLRREDALPLTLIGTGLRSLAALGARFGVALADAVAAEDQVDLDRVDPVELLAAGPLAKSEAGRRALSRLWAMERRGALRGVTEGDFVACYPWLPKALARLMGRVRTLTRSAPRFGGGGPRGVFAVASEILVEMELDVPFDDRLVPMDLAWRPLAGALPRLHARLQERLAHPDGDALVARVARTLAVLGGAEDLRLDTAQVAEALLDRVGPKPSALEVHGALDALHQLGLARWDDEGGWRLSDAPVEGRPARAWVFQANPALYPLAEELDAHADRPGWTLDWRVTRYRDQLSVGDDAILWQSGPDAGAYALATIASEPYEGEDFEGNLATLVNLEVGPIFEAPVLRADLLEDEVLQHLDILRAPQGTNFKVSPEQWAALAPRWHAAGDRRPAWGSARSRVALLDALAEALPMPPRLLRRYHLALSTHGVVLLRGRPGSGRRALVRRYAHAVGARLLHRPASPAWDHGEDLMGDPDVAALLEEGDGRPTHVLVDGMHLAPEGHALARLLSTLSHRRHTGAVGAEVAVILVASPDIALSTHLLAHAHTLHLRHDEGALAALVKGQPWGEVLLELADALREVAPVGPDLVDAVARYVEEAGELGASQEEALDEVATQVLLPRLEGEPATIGDALRRLLGGVTRDLPLTRRAAEEMQREMLRRR